VSGILQRLAGQAMGAQAKDAPRIRPAASVHAPVPIGPSRDGESSQPLSPLLPDTTPRSGSLRYVTTERTGLAKESTTVVHSVETIRGPAMVQIPQRATATRAVSEIAQRDESNRRDPRDFADKAPQPLLDEVEAVSQAPNIRPVPPSPPLMSAARAPTHDEPTEVHVHIGRIEVIAAPEPAPPKKNRAAPTRNTLPLADYLARRRTS
jgi:hypothetical protein